MQHITFPDVKKQIFMMHLIKASPTSVHTGCYSLPVSVSVWTAESGQPQVLLTSVEVAYSPPTLTVTTWDYEGPVQVVALDVI